MERIVDEYISDEHGTDTSGHRDERISDEYDREHGTDTSRNQPGVSRRGGLGAGPSFGLSDRLGGRDG